MRNLKQWFRRNHVDLAYVSMLKHDAYVVVRAGKRLGFPVVLRPEGAGTTGDIAWQSWGNFGRIIGLTCRRARSLRLDLRNQFRKRFRNRSARERCDLFERWRREILSRLPHESSQFPMELCCPNQPGTFDLAGTWLHVQSLWAGSHQKRGWIHWSQLGLTYRLRFPTAQLILIGEGTERVCSRTFGGMVGLTVGPAQSLEFPGSLASTTDVLRNADLFVLPSREEGMSIALLEAMALGMPVVASSIFGNQRLVDDFEHGRLVPPDDPVRLACAIVEQWQNLDRAVQMGVSARRRVEREFSIEVVARKHLELFRELIRIH